MSELEQEIIKLFEWYGKMPVVEHLKSTASLADFTATGDLYQLIRQLSELLAVSDWNSEIQEHIYFQLRKDITNCFTVSKSTKDSLSNSKLNKQQWLKVRDGLAAVWDWWVEEYLLRYQFSPNQSDTVKSPYIYELLKLCLSREQNISLHDLDSKLGEAFFFLAVVVHHLILQQESKKINPAFVDFALYLPQNKYQTQAVIDNVVLTRFAPGRKGLNRFLYICHRINASKAKADTPFPSFNYMASVDLAEINLNWIDFQRANLTGANLSRANLYGANLTGANLSKANLSFVSLSRINLSRANLSGAILHEVDFSQANLNRANLTGAKLDYLLFIETHLIGANLSNAQLNGTILYRANLREANLKQANLDGANLREASLAEADLTQANLMYSSLSRANLREANLDGANLYKAQCDEADFKEIQWDEDTNWLEINGLDSAIDVPVELKANLDQR